MRYWEYYIALESDLLSCRRYVEFTPQNLGTYSQEFMHLLFATCSEVEIVLKQLCARLGNRRADKIAEYRAVVEPQLELSSFQVNDLVRGDMFPPFAEWKEVESPTWWRAYNGVKHNRSTKFGQANLENCINAMAGLFVVNLYQERNVVEDTGLVPESRLFRPQLRAHSRQFHGVPSYLLPNAKKLASA